MLRSEKRFGVEPEITAKIARMGCRVYEVGISYNGRSYQEGKKIGWRDAVTALGCIVRYGLFHRPDKTIDDILASASSSSASTGGGDDSETAGSEQTPPQQAAEPAPTSESATDVAGTSESTPDDQTDNTKAVLETA